MKTLLLLGVSTALAACATAPDLPTQDSLAPAAQPDVGIRLNTPSDPLAGYTARAVKGPEDWRALNRRQSPAGEEAQ